MAGRRRRLRRPLRRPLHRPCALATAVVLAAAGTTAATGDVALPGVPRAAEARPATLADLSPLRLDLTPLPRPVLEPGVAGVVPGGASPSTDAPGSLTPVAARPSALTRPEVADVPGAALAAYQRAAAVLAASDPGCGLDWELLAAVGLVESDHGRYGGGTLDGDGLQRPALVGIRLDGSRGTRRIRDTDAGQLDGDRRFDRAVGPMQFIPSTWALVGVDADGDDRRDPQDVDDAALAAGVLLCGEDDDLRTVPGREAALLRYNASRAYAVQVLAARADYVADRPATVAPVAAPAGVALPTPPSPVVPASSPGRGADRPRGEGRGQGEGRGDAGRGDQGRGDGGRDDGDRDRGPRGPQDGGPQEPEAPGTPAEPVDPTAPEQPDEPNGPGCETGDPDAPSGPTAPAEPDPDGEPAPEDPAPEQPTAPAEGEPTEGEPTEEPPADGEPCVLPDEPADPDQPPADPEATPVPLL